VFVGRGRKEKRKKGYLFIGGALETFAQVGERKKRTTYGVKFKIGPIGARGRRAPEKVKEKIRPPSRFGGKGEKKSNIPLSYHTRWGEREKGVYLLLDEKGGECHLQAHSF